ncbi:MAG: hypothetical protein RL033_4231 [Pseudomonadota bacterium]
MNFQKLLAPEPPPWSTVEARQAAVLVDADIYYATFYQAALLAQRSVCLAGWQFDSLARLLRPAAVEPTPGRRTEHPIELLPFLEHLCERSPRLEVFILAWDYSLVYALEREWLQRLKFEFQSHSRVHFAFSSHPGMGGCLHQKYALIDSRVAFVGGLDLCDSRWDTRAHVAADQRRLDVRGNPYKAFHDIQLALRGPVVKALRGLFRESWERARSDEPIPSQPSSTLGNGSVADVAGPPSVRAQELQELPSEQALSDSQPPERTEASAADPYDLMRLSGGRALVFGATRLGLSRTDIVSTSQPPTFEVRLLFERAIEAAERVIYVETQYFTSRVIAQALCRRFADPERSKLDVILVMPDGADTPKEDLVLGARQRAVRHRVAREAERHGHRFRLLKSVLKSAPASATATFIHAKLLIVDDELLNIGSANLTNRSMGLDTELNVSSATGLEDPRDAARLRSEIAAIRADLLAEHAGLDDASRFLSLDGLIEAVDEACNDPSSKLCSQVIREPERSNELLSSLFDPARPLDWESVDESLRNAKDWLQT